jgi:hypothetical protein
MAGDSFITNLMVGRRKHENAMTRAALHMLKRSVCTSAESQTRKFPVFLQGSRRNSHSTRPYDADSSVIANGLACHLLVSGCLHGSNIDVHGKNVSFKT